MRQFIGMMATRHTADRRVARTTVVRDASAGLPTERLRSAEVRGQFSIAAGKAQLRTPDALGAWGAPVDDPSALRHRRHHRATALGPSGPAVAHPPVGHRSLRVGLLLLGPYAVLLLYEPDNFPTYTQRWVMRAARSAKSVLYVSHDRELLAQTPTVCRI